MRRLSSCLRPLSDLHSRLLSVSASCRSASRWTTCPCSTNIFPRRKPTAKSWNPCPTLGKLTRWFKCDKKGVRQGATAASACCRLWKHFLSVLRLHLHPNGPQKLRSRILENTSTLSLGSNRSKTFLWNFQRLEWRGKKRNWFTSDPISQWIHFPYMLLPHSASLIRTLAMLKRVSVQGRHLARGPFLPVTPSKIELHVYKREDAWVLSSQQWSSFFLFFKMKYFYVYSTWGCQTHAPRTAHTQEEMNQHVLGDRPRVLNRVLKLFQKTIFLYHTFDITAHVCIFKHYTLCSSNPSCNIVEINVLCVWCFFLI